MKVKIKLKKPHPNKHMFCGPIDVVDEFKEVDIDEKYLKTKEAKAWFEFEELKQRRSQPARSEKPDTGKSNVQLD